MRALGDALAKGWLTWEFVTFYDDNIRKEPLQGGSGHEPAHSRTNHDRRSTV